MKFLSKHIHFRLVLRPSIPENITAGRIGVPGLYVLFQDGMATITDPEVIKLLLAHPQFNDSFTVVKDEEEALFSARPSNAEPEHDISNLEYGHVGKALNPKKGVPMTPEMKKAVTEMATQIAMDILKAQALKDKAKTTTTTTKEVVKADQDEVPTSSAK